MMEDLLMDVQNVSATSGDMYPNGAHLCRRPKLHDVTQLRRVQILLGHWPEEVHAALVDAQNELRRQQPNGVLNALDREEDAVAVRQRAQDAQKLQACFFIAELL